MARTGVVGCRLVHISRVVRIHGRFHGEFCQRHIAMTQWLAVSSTTHVSVLHNDNLREFFDHGLVLEREHTEWLELAEF
jgi:hypothetical protein